MIDSRWSAIAMSMNIHLGATNIKMFFSFRLSFGASLLSPAVPYHRMTAIYINCLLHTTLWQESKPG